MEAFERLSLASLAGEFPKLELLEKKWEEWGREFEAGNIGWSWRQGVYEDLRAALGSLNNHCHFCDDYPFAPETVEHYKPKAEFKREAYHWPNLYLACTLCQQSASRDGVYEETLRPDAESFSFAEFFFL